MSNNLPIVRKRIPFYIVPSNKIVGSLFVLSKIFLEFFFLELESYFNMDIAELSDAFRNEFFEINDFVDDLL